MITILDSFILFLISPVGFLLSISLLIYLEYLTVKNIIKDPGTKRFATIIANYIHQYRLKKMPLNLSEKVALDTVSRREDIGTKEIAENVGIAVTTTRKLMKDLADKGYVHRKINMNDRRSFSYAISPQYMQKMKRHHA